MAEFAEVAFKLAALGARHWQSGIVEEEVGEVVDGGGLRVVDDFGCTRHGDEVAQVARVVGGVDECSGEE